MMVAALRKGGVMFSGKDPGQTFYTILSRNAIFTNVGKSTWGLSSWYPDRVRKSGKANASAPEIPDDGLSAPVDQAPEDDVSEPTEGQPLT